MNRTFRIASVTAALALVGAACTSGTTAGGGATTPTTPAPATAGVDVVDIAFEPAETRVNAGDTVRWEWKGDLSHSVTADDGSFDAGTNDKGHTFERTFDTPGRIEYYCREHSTADGTAQNGVIIVE